MTEDTEQRRRLKARKVPRQKRSRSVVDAIKQAALELATARDFSTADTSTSLIAERAGISVGSLYQYFPSREAIFLALFEDRCAEMTVTVKQAMVRIMAQPLAQGIPRVLRHLLTAFRENELVMLKMVKQIPELQLATQPLAFENVIFESTRIAINQWNPGLSLAELDRRAFFVREIILASIYRYINDPPDHVTDRTFLEDLSQIVVLYIALPAKRQLAAKTLR